MIDISKATKLVDLETGSIGAERIDLAASVGRILSEDIIADTDLPPFDRSQMDGFAVVAVDTKNAPVALKIVGESAAGRGWHKTTKRGQAVRIMTGAPVPMGADAVQKIELTSETKNGIVTINEPTEKGRFIVRKASEIKKGSHILKSGEVINENMIATLAAFGYAKIKVSKRPRVAILGTGSEIVEISKKPGRDQIRNSNSVMLDVLARKFGAATMIFPISKDEISNLKSQISNAAKNTEILVITGGVSVGKYDLTKTVLLELGAEIFFDKVRLKPGKPAVFARLGKTLVFGLPGNPVSAAVTFHLFVRKAILKMQGASTTDMQKGFAILGADARSARERDTYLPSRLETNKLGQLVAHPLKWQGSSDFIGYARADSMIFVPRGKQLAKGAVAEIVFL
ncbi:MAG: molybdopterin molybdotransferase MoeA [Chloracidobacterium sp.]|nr:molybdopterin molybdotransferase MoeA [Chloracidobacterium sp.]